jgi:hypothetical protein
MIIRCSDSSSERSKRTERFIILRIAALSNRRPGCPTLVVGGYTELAIYRVSQRILASLDEFEIEE